jgi:hypothetical protein
MHSQGCGRIGLRSAPAGPGARREHAEPAGVRLATCTSPVRVPHRARPFAGPGVLLRRPMDPASSSLDLGEATAHELTVDTPQHMDGRSQAGRPAESLGAVQSPRRACDEEDRVLRQQDAGHASKDHSSMQFKRTAAPRPDGCHIRGHRSSSVAFRDAEHRMDTRESESMTMTPRIQISTRSWPRSRRNPHRKLQDSGGADPDVSNSFRV